MQAHVTSENIAARAGLHAAPNLTAILADAQPLKIDTMFRGMKHPLTGKRGTEARCALFVAIRIHVGRHATQQRFGAAEVTHLDPDRR